MRLLIVSATHLEISNVLHFFEIDYKNNKNFYEKSFGINSVSFLITGIGSYAMIYELTKLLMQNKDFDLIINAGIAGSYKDDIKIGDIVFVRKEYVGDLGIDDNGRFITLWETDLFNGNEKDIFDKSGTLVNPIQETCSFTKREVVSVTVNTVSGSEDRIRLLRDKFDGDIESMEGAAFFYVCLKEKMPFMEIRAVSNPVTSMNKEKWQIMTAVSKLNETLKFFILEKLNQ